MKVDAPNKTECAILRRWYASSLSGIWMTREQVIVMAHQLARQGVVVDWKAIRVEVVLAYANAPIPQPVPRATTAKKEVKPITGMRVANVAARMLAAQKGGSNGSQDNQRQ